MHGQANPGHRQQQHRGTAGLHLRQRAHEHILDDVHKGIKLPGVQLALDGRHLQGQEGREMAIQGMLLLRMCGWLMLFSLLMSPVRLTPECRVGGQG